MNIVLLYPADFVSPRRAVIAGRRLEHLTRVLRVGDGAEVRVGHVGGGLGTARVTVLGDSVLLDCAFDQRPPPRSRVDLIIALPRPKILRRVLQALASMGVSTAVLVGSYRVEKSYFQSPLLDADALQGQLALGLEQAGDTVLPNVQVRRFFKPFVQDELGALFPDHQRLLAHPRSGGTLASPGRDRAVVAIGPEGGWTDYESDLLRASGFAPWSFGPRILRVDVAVPWVVAQVELAFTLPSAAGSPSLP